MATLCLEPASLCSSCRSANASRSMARSRLSCMCAKVCSSSFSYCSLSSLFSSSSLTLFSYSFCVSAWTLYPSFITSAVSLPRTSGSRQIPHTAMPMPLISNLRVRSFCNILWPNAQKPTAPVVAPKKATDNWLSTSPANWVS